MDDFCAARTDEIPALLWPNFAPPYTLEIYGVGARTTVGFGRFMSKDALEQLKQDAIREDAERKARARERAEIEKSKRDEVRALWVPKVGDEVSYEHAEIGECYKITEVRDNGDFMIQCIGDRNPLLSDATECEPIG